MALGDTMYRSKEAKYLFEAGSLVVPLRNYFAHTTILLDDAST
jgi:hypothetical protein